MLIKTDNLLIKMKLIDGMQSCIVGNKMKVVEKTKKRLVGSKEV